MTDLEEIVECVVRRVLAERDAKPAAELVTVHAFAVARSLGVSTVRKMIRDGRLPAKRIGRAVRIASDAEIGEPVNATAPAETDASFALRVIGGGR